MLWSDHLKTTQQSSKKKQKCCRTASADRCTKQTGTIQLGKEKKKNQREKTENTEIYKIANEVVTGKIFSILSHTTKIRRHSMRLLFIAFKTKKTPLQNPGTDFCTNCGIHHTVYCRSYRHKLFKRPRQIHRRQVRQALLNMTVSTYPLAQATSKPFTACRCAEE